MAMTLAERLQWIVEHRGISMRALSEKAGLSHSALWHKVRKGTPINSDALARIAIAMRVNGDWLLTGRGRPELAIIAMVTDEGAAFIVEEKKTDRPAQASLPAEDFDQGTSPQRAKKLPAKRT